MPPDLSSANWKIDRAIELLAQLDKEVVAWFDTKPYSFYTYVSPEKTRASVIVRENTKPEVIRWSLMAADIIHNLRCALDHAFWAVLQSEFPNGIPPEAEKMSFPIWDRPPNAGQRKNFKPLGSKLFAAIESVQPYHHPDPRYIIHPLVVIRDIDNGNKHKLLFTLMPSIGRINVEATGLRKKHHDAVTEEFYRGPLEDNVEVLIATFAVPHPYMKYVCTSCVAILAVLHPVTNRLGQDRDDYAALIDTFTSEVRRTIAALVAAVT